MFRLFCHRLPGPGPMMPKRALILAHFARFLHIIFAWAWPKEQRGEEERKQTARGSTLVAFHSVPSGARPLIFWTIERERWNRMKYKTIKWLLNYATAWNFATAIASASASHSIRLQFMCISRIIIWEMCVELFYGTICWSFFRLPGIFWRRLSLVNRTYEYKGTIEIPFQWHFIIPSHFDLEWHANVLFFNSSASCFY